MYLQVWVYKKSMRHEKNVSCVFRFRTRTFEPVAAPAQQGEACAFAHRACGVACGGCFRRVRLQCQVNDGCGGIGTCPDNMAPTSPALHGSTSKLRVRRCREGTGLNAERFFSRGPRHDDILHHS